MIGILVAIVIVVLLLAAILAAWIYHRAARVDVVSFDLPYAEALEHVCWARQFRAEHGACCDYWLESL